MVYAAMWHMHLAFKHLYSILSCDFVLIHFLKSGIETPDRKGQRYQHLLTLFVFVFYDSNSEGDSLSDYVDNICVCSVHVLYCIPCCSNGLADEKKNQR